MAYLHYNFSNDSLKRIEDRCISRGGRLEVQRDEIAERIKRYDQAPLSLKRKAKEIEKQQNDNDAQYDDVYEELWWRDDPDSLIQDYQKRGHELMFRCGTHEFDTEKEALSEANFQHTYNDVLLDYGADGDGIDDMIPRQDMIQAFFRRG